MIAQLIISLIQMLGIKMSIRHLLMFILSRSSIWMTSLFPKTIG